MAASSNGRGAGSRGSARTAGPRSAGTHSAARPAARTGSPRTGSLRAGSGRTGTQVADPPAELDTGRDRVRLARQRRSRLLAVGLVLGCALLIAYDVIRPGSSSSPVGAAPPATSAAPATVPTTAPTSAAPPVVPVVHKGTGAFTYAGPAPTWSGSEGPVYGAAGALNRYRVAVEGGLGVDAADFAAGVDAVLGDPRSWTAGNDVRFQRVAGSGPANFTVYLASPATSQQMCRAAGIETDQVTNCRLSGKIVINSARWLTAVSDYGAPLDVYRAYAVNHEVGHQLGWWHEDCPAPGQPAPVMQQQTLGLQGCVANAWPYLDGVRYRGPTAAV